VEKTGENKGYPISIDQAIDPSKHADELVVFDDAQALPLFIFEI